MSDPTANPALDLPGDITEAELLALIEGTPLSADRAARVREVVSADPNLASLVSAMQGDRGELTSLAALRAPSDMIERVEAQLEREALVGLARSESSVSVDRIPISSFGPKPLPLTQQRWFRGLAAAASLAIGVGGGTLLLSALKPEPRTFIAGDQPINRPDPRLFEGPDQPAPGGTDQVKLASKTTPASPEIKPDVDPAPAPRLTASTAVDLAREGRLLIRIRTKNTDQAIARLDNLALRHLSNVSVARLSPPSYSVASSGLIEMHRRRFEPKTDGGPAMASSHASDRGAAPAVPVSLPPIPPPQLDPVGFNVSVTATPAMLEELRSELSGTAFTAEFIALPEPMPLEPVGDAESLLWWVSPVSTWGPRASVTVLVEQR